MQTQPASAGFRRAEAAYRSNKSNAFGGSGFRTGAGHSVCRQYLEQLRWPEDFVCPRCGGTKSWTAQRARPICAACRYQATVTAGTIFHDGHLPLPLLFRAFWQVTSQKYGASALGVQRVLGLGSYETAWSWLHKLRWAMVRPGRDRLSARVEVDETYVGGMAEGKRGRGPERKALVVIAAQEDGLGIGRIRLARVADAGAASLDEFTFRFNRRNSAWRGKLCYRLVEQAVQVQPAPRATLVGGKNNPHSTC